MKTKPQKCPWCGPDGYASALQLTKPWHRLKDAFVVRCGKCEAHGPQEFSRTKAIRAWKGNFIHAGICPEPEHTRDQLAIALDKIRETKI